MLAAIRRLIADIAGPSESYSDLDLVNAISDAVREMTVLGLANISVYTVDTTANIDTGVVISPTVAAIDGQTIVFAVAVDILNDILTGKLLRGELGTAWKSGLESETSNTAAKEFRNQITALDVKRDQLILTAILSQTAARVM